MNSISNFKFSNFIATLFLVFAVASATTFSQETSESRPAASQSTGQATDEITGVKPMTGDEIAESEKKILNLIAKLRGCLQRAKSAQFSYISGKFDESEGWHSAYQKEIALGEPIRRELMDLAYPVILQSKLSPEMEKMAIVILQILFDEQQYERAYQVATRLDQIESTEDSKYFRMRTAVLTNRFGVAQELRDEVASRVTKLPKMELEMLKSLPDFVRIATDEESLRRADATSNLPRVEMVTSEGTMILELFEDQYPETVGHFISLVEKDFYKDKAFHRVTKNFMPFSIAQSGLVLVRDVPDSPGQKFIRPDPIDYTVVDEAPRDGNVRRHLRGVLSLCISEDPKKKERVPNSAGSQFMITLVPSPGLDGNQIAFGRVIEGLDVFDRFIATTTISEEDGKETPIDGIKEFSKILEVKVLRKRDHEYLPNKVKK